MASKKIGVLLVNLGTPTEPTAKAVRRFLRDFLSDPRVVDTPRIIWLPILYGIILTLRPSRVAKNYKKIWTDAGSPLMANSLAQQHLLQSLFEQISPELNVKVELAMTYGEPSLKNSTAKLNQWGADQIVVLPLYPQYSKTTTAAVTDQLAKITQSTDIKFDVIQDYHQETSYIEALAKSIQPHLNSNTKLVMSFHGIPKRFVAEGDPYQSHCETTAKLLAQTLSLSSTEWEIAYQSRVGREEWLTPYLDKRLVELAQAGDKNIVVVCPGFSVDCLETLEEIAMENRETFLSAGGETFEYVSALNATPDHIQMMAELVLKRLK